MPSINDPITGLDDMSIPAIGSIPAIAAINSRSDSDAGANYEEEGDTGATVGSKRDRSEHTELGVVDSSRVVSLAAF